MSTFAARPGLNLPPYEAARYRIEQLVAADTAAAHDLESLATQLSGVASALGFISITHGTIAFGDYNMGLMHEYTSDSQARRFTVHSDDIFPATMRDAGIFDPPESLDMYSLEAEVPSDAKIQQLLGQDRSAWHDNNPDSGIFSASHITKDGQRTEYFPFKTHTFRPKARNVCLPESVQPYFGVVQQLSRQLLEVTANMPQAARVWVPRATE